MRRIKIAQIGVNLHSHAPEVLMTLKSLPDIFDLVGYALVEDERETCKTILDKYYAGIPEMTLDEILSDPTIEAVTVETDEIHLTKYAQMAAEAGKHIHMEKPGSQDLAAFEKLIETVRGGDKIFHIGYMYRYNPYIADTVRRAKAGEFGHIYSIEAHMSRFDNKATREWFGLFQGGMMFYLGCHLIDLVLQIQGMPTEIIPLNTATGIDGVDTEDLGCAVLKYPNALSFIRMGGTEVGGFDRRQLVVCGSRRTVEIKPLEAKSEGEFMLCTGKRESFRVPDPEKPESTKSAHTDSTSEPFHRYKDMMQAFAAMVRGEKENPYTCDYELTLFKTILACCGVK